MFRRTPLLINHRTPTSRHKNVIVLHQDKPEKLSSAVLEEYGVLLRQSLRSMFGLGATPYSLQTIFDASHRIVNARETQRFVILLAEVCTEYCEAVKRFATREALQPGPIVEEICKAFEQYTMHITNVERTFRCIDDSLTNCGEKPTEGLKVRALNVFRDVVIYQTEALFPTLDIQFCAGLEKSKSCRPGTTFDVFTLQWWLTLHSMRRGTFRGDGFAFLRRHVGKVWNNRTSAVPQNHLSYPHIHPKVRNKRSQSRHLR